MCRWVCQPIVQRAPESAILGPAENQIMYFCHDITEASGNSEAKGSKRSPGSNSSSAAQTVANGSKVRRRTSRGTVAFQEF
jgi:hypothetical protein